MNREETDSSPRLRLVGAASLVVCVAIVGAWAGSGFIDDAVEPTPDASFTHTYSDGTVIVTHAGGDAVTAEQTARLELVSVDGTSSTTWAAGTEPFPIVEGDSARLSGIEPGDAVLVLWTGSDDDATVDILTKFEVESV